MGWVPVGFWVHVAIARGDDATLKMGVGCGGVR